MKVSNYSIYVSVFLYFLFGCSLFAIEHTAQSDVLQNLMNSQKQRAELTKEKLDNLRAFAKAGQNAAFTKSSMALEKVWQANYAGGTDASSDFGTAIVKDMHGNIFAAGYSNDGSYSEPQNDFVILKYNGTGEREWSVRIDGRGGMDDKANALTVDDAGNCYVTGVSGDPSGDYDYLTVKINGQGVEQWRARYIGPGNDYDTPLAIAVDVQHNVYVSGVSTGSQGVYEFATIKYDRNGQQVWAKRFLESGYSQAAAFDIALDNEGNIFVTGWSYRPLTNTDITVLKYNSDGEKQWSAHYTNGSDYPSAMALDEKGNCYVVGYSSAPVTGYDIVVLKYSGSGTQEWTRRYNGPAGGDDFGNAVAIDNAGNALVAAEIATSENGKDYATIKYDSSGTQMWTSFYNGDANGDDASRSIACDGSGNVYVTGLSDGINSNYFCTTVKYNKNGDEIWVARDEGVDVFWGLGRAIFVGDDGKPVITGLKTDYETSTDFFVTGYNTSGETAWTDSYNGSWRSRETASFMFVDNEGNIYVAGQSISGPFVDDALVKFNKDGVEQWNARNEALFSITGLAVDAAGNVFTTGETIGPDSSVDFATVKYNPQGVEEWVTFYNGPAKGNDRSFDLDVDSKGNAYVTGRSYDENSRYDYVTVKYNTAGQLQWVARYDGSGDSDIPFKICVDESDNIYVTGTSFGETAGDFVTIKYDASGEVKWIARYDGPDSGYDNPSAIVVDKSANVYVTGGSFGNNTSNDFATVKYDSSGVEQWAVRYNSSSDDYDSPVDMGLDAAGNVYVTGATYGAETNFITLKYNSSGVEQWHRVYDGPDNRYDSPSAMFIDPVGNVYVTGESQTETSSDYATVKYSSSGTEQWVEVFDGPVNKYDGAVGVFADDENVIVAGTSTFERGTRFTAIKYKDTVTGIGSFTTAPAEFNLEQNFPNPFNPVTKIRFTLNNASKVQLIIFDITGREVARLVDGKLTAGLHSRIFNASNLASGVYLYQLRVNDLIRTKKLTVLK